MTLSLCEQPAKRVSTSLSRTGRRPAPVGAFWSLPRGCDLPVSPRFISHGYRSSADPPPAPPVSIRRAERPGRPRTRTAPNLRAQAARWYLQTFERPANRSTIPSGNARPASRSRSTIRAAWATIERSVVVSCRPLARRSAISATARSTVARSSAVRRSRRSPGCQVVAEQ